MATRKHSTGYMEANWGDATRGYLELMKEIPGDTIRQIVQKAKKYIVVHHSIGTSGTSVKQEAVPNCYTKLVYIPDSDSE